MMKKFFNLIKNVKFQFFCIFITMSIISTLLIIEHNRENYAEKIYPILKVKDEIKKIASNVEVGLFINNFPTFLINKNQFTFDAVTWFKFPVGSESLQTIDKFDFKNGEITYKSPPMIKLLDDKVVVAYQVKVDFKAYLNYKDFPLGDHRLNIILENRSVTQNELCFNSELNNFMLAKDIFVSTWRPVRKIVQVGYLNSDLKKDNNKMNISYPCAVFTIDFENTSLRDLITLYFPMYVIFLICIFSMMIEFIQYVQRITIISASVPILVLFRMVILQLSPDMAEITKADFTYFLLVFLSLLLLVYQGYTTLVMKQISVYNEEIQKKRIAQLEKANNLILLITLLMLLVAVTYNSFYA